MKKRILTGACAFMLAASLLVPGVSAAGEIKFTILSTDKAPVADGKITQEEYAGNEPVVFDGSGKNTESGWNASTSWADHVIKLYYTWDMDNLYVGISVAGETTASQNIPFTKNTDCIWGKGDMIQLGFNPGMIIEGVEPLYFCVGFDEDKQPTIHGDAYQSEKDGEQTLYLDDVIKGYSRKYTADGVNYECEVAIPWEYIFVKGACRSGQGAKVFDMTGEAAKLGDGYELPILMLYRDMDGNRIYRTAAKSTNYSWDAKDMFPLALVLKEAPKAAESNPQTADGASMAILALAASALCGAAIIGRRRQK